MKAYSNALTNTDFYEAAAVVRAMGHDFWIEELTEHSGRKRARSFTFYGEAYKSNRRSNRQGRSDAYAATWADWGWFLAELFNRDPHAIIGEYNGADDFRRQCQRTHEHRKQHGFRTQFDPGCDISFLDYLNVEVAV